MEIVKRIDWHMAHRIYAYNGLCGNLHGHTYRLDVALGGDVSPDTGMVEDFTDLKKRILGVLEVFDHATVLWQRDPLAEALLPYSTRLLLLSHNATAENMVQYFYNKLSENLPSLSWLRLWETDTSSAIVRSCKPDVCVIFDSSKTNSAQVNNVWPTNFDRSWVKPE